MDDISHVTGQLVTLFKWVLSWSNANQGAVSIYLFLLTLFLGWVSGIFGSLRRKPKFRFKAIDGPSFVCTFGTGGQYDSYDAHRTGIAIYLHITNVGSAPASIIDIEVGYRWAIRPFGRLWWQYGLGRFWLTNQAIALQDFQVSIGDNTKVYPFLIQRSGLSGTSSETYLEIGKSTNGVVYFEQSDSYGACFPVSIANRVHLKVRIRDSFDGVHTKKIVVPKVTLAAARAYNPSFGLTLSTLQGGNEPIDLPADLNGNLIPPSDQTASTSK